MTLSELLAGLENAEVMDVKSKLRRKDQSIVGDTRRMLEIHKMVARLRLQRDAMDRTLLAIEDLAENGLRRPANVYGASRGTRAAKK